jgi:hypothetical protein
LEQDHQFLVSFLVFAQAGAMENAKKTPGVDSAESEALYGYVFSVSGPVVVADHMTGSAMYELVCAPRLCYFGTLYEVNARTGLRAFANLP